MIYIREYGNLRQISKQIFQLQLESYRINYIEKYELIHTNLYFRY